MLGVNATIDNFKSEVLEYKGTVLVDFGASWCGPCQMLTPILEEIKNELKNNLKIVTIDVDSQTKLASDYNVDSIPTVIIFCNGQIKQVLIGFRQKQDYLSAIKK